MDPKSAKFYLLSFCSLIFLFTAILSFLSAPFLYLFRMPPLLSTRYGISATAGVVAPPPPQCAATVAHLPLLICAVASPHRRCFDLTSAHSSPLLRPRHRTVYLHTAPTPPPCRIDLAAPSPWLGVAQPHASPLIALPSVLRRLTSDPELAPVRYVPRLRVAPAFSFSPR